MIKRRMIIIIKMTMIMIKWRVKIGSILTIMPMMPLMMMIKIRKGPEWDVVCNLCGSQSSKNETPQNKLASSKMRYL